MSSTPTTYNVSTTGEVTTVIVIILFLIFMITLILYLRANHYPGALGASRLVFATNRSSPLLHHPLDSDVLKSLPIAAFHLEDFKERGGLECAVCLSEFTDGENARVLPECNHGFHVECIDMWFGSNSTCPLCRLPVAPLPDVAVLTDSLRISSVTNFDEASSSDEPGCAVMIDIPSKGSAVQLAAGETSTLPVSSISVSLL